MGCGLMVAILKGISMQGIVLNWKTDIWIPLIIVIGSIGTIRLTKWGRWISYLVSFFFLFSVPIGTFLGGFMIWHLTKYRAKFCRWY